MGSKKNDMQARIAELEAEVADAKRHQLGAQKAAAKRAQERDQVASEAERQRTMYEMQEAQRRECQRRDRERKAQAKAAEARRKNLADLGVGIVSLKDADVSFHHDKGATSKTVTIELSLDGEEVKALSRFVETRDSDRVDSVRLTAGQLSASMFAGVGVPSWMRSFTLDHPLSL